MAPEPDPGAAFSREHVVGWLRGFEEATRTNRVHLTELDSAIGDADHGTNLARGMAAVVEVLDDVDADATIEELCKRAGMTLVSKVGGASGPLYGTLFLRFGTGAGSVASLDAAALATALAAARDGVVARGKAEVGDKTMLDALDPAVTAVQDAIEAGQDLATAVRAGAAAASAGRDATEDLVARKGRASYLGERSRGHVDPGAASTTMLVEALAAAVAP